MTDNMAAKKRQRTRTPEQEAAPIQDGSLENVTADTDEGQDSEQEEEDGSNRPTPASE